MVLADLHLTRRSPPEVGKDLARLLRRHAGERVIVAGDFFDLAIDMPRASRARAVAEVLAAQPVIREALARHLDGGGSLWFAPGNHDPDVGKSELRQALVDAIDPAPQARGRLHTTAWFFRDGGLHVEHGHVYDPDNAPAHPLALGARSLGTHFCMEFMHPTGALDYLLTNDSTPGKLFVAAFTGYGWRGPYVVFRYFYAAFGALLQSGPWYRGAREPALGRREHEAFAATAGVPVALVDRLYELVAEPTLTSLPGTFARLYLDRVLATVSVGGGLGAMALGRHRAGAWAVAGGAALMLGSWLRGHDRYRGGVMDRLAAAADAVAAVADAELVVFGHTHRECEGPRYINAGSFAHPRTPAEPGRPYVVVEPHGGVLRAARRRIMADQRDA